jgi:hypothetical protein
MKKKFVPPPTLHLFSLSPNLAASPSHNTQQPNVERTTTHQHNNNLVISLGETKYARSPSSQNLVTQTPPPLSLLLRLANAGAFRDHNTTPQLARVPPATLPASQPHSFTVVRRLRLSGLTSGNGSRRSQASQPTTTTMSDAPTASQESFLQRWTPSVLKVRLGHVYERRRKEEKRREEKRTSRRRRAPGGGGRRVRTFAHRARGSVTPPMRSVPRSLSLLSISLTHTHT